MKTLFFCGLAVLTFAACTFDKEAKRINQMEGTWDITRISLDSVGSDGTHRTLLTGEDAGTFVFSPSDGNHSSFTDFTYDFTLGGQHYFFSGDATYDDEIERLQVYFENCGEVFNCDGLYEVRTFSKREMEMTRYLPSGIIGQVKYLTFTLKKQ